MILPVQHYPQWRMNILTSGPNNLSPTKFIVLNTEVFKECMTTPTSNVPYDGRVNGPNSTMTPIDGVSSIVTILSFK